MANTLQENIDGMKDWLVEIRRTIHRSVRTKVYRFLPGIKGLVSGTLKGSKLLFDKSRKSGNLDSVENISGRSQP